MRVEDYPNYEPSHFGGPIENPESKEPPLIIEGDADHHEQRRTDDDYIQPGNLFRLLSAEEQRRLIENIVGTLKNVPKFIQERMIQHFSKADSAYGGGIAKGLGFPEK